jgi:4-hydroxybenzoate polyprenyltransferase
LSTHPAPPISTDIQTRCWFDRFLPSRLQPYARLARWDRPIGIWLLFWPCAWGLFLSPTFINNSFSQQLIWLALFWVGSVTMRGAGCTINDMWDRKLDAQVARTSSRPLANGTISIAGAFAFLGLQSLVGLIVLVFLPLPAAILAVIYAPLIIIYPLMKRITMWPQAFLAIVFSAGAPIGWFATGADFNLTAVILSVSSMVWVLGYDTIYAHMDQRDDALIGIKSTVIRFGDRATHLIGWCFAFLFAGWVTIAITQNFNWFSWLMLGAGFFFQIIRFLTWEPENDAMSLNYFKYQHGFAAMLALACWYNALNHIPITG